MDIIFLALFSFYMQLCLCGFASMALAYVFFVLSLLNVPVVMLCGILLIVLLRFASSCILVACGRDFFFQAHDYPLYKEKKTFYLCVYGVPVCAFTCVRECLCVCVRVFVCEFIFQDGREKKETCSHIFLSFLAAVPE